MQTEEILPLPRTITVKTGTKMTFAILAFAAYGAGTAGTQAAIVLTTFMRDMQARKASRAKRNHAIM
jgi:hypothetical protein